LVIVVEVELSEDADDTPVEKVEESADLAPSLEEDKFSDEDDLDDYEKLKTKVEMKMGEGSQKGMLSMSEMKPPEPKHLYREEVIDDFIRNFLKKYNMTETLNIFQEEWHNLFKKGAFHDNELGNFTDIHNKNAKLRAKYESMSKEVEAATAKAEKEKKNWEQIRKERDFHVTHFNRVEKEKKELYEQIKMLKDKHALFEQSIDELWKKYELTMKQKILIKLNKDTKTREIEALRGEIKNLEQALTKGDSNKAKVVGKLREEKVLIVEHGKPTPWPENARTNPYRGRNFDMFNAEISCTKSIPVL
jgi:chromosome segregation ATPase